MTFPVDAYLCGHDHNLQHFFHKRIHYFVSGLGELPNPNLKNMNHHMNPIEDFDFFTILRGEGGGVLLVEGMFWKKLNTHYLLLLEYLFNFHAVDMDS